MIKIDKPAITRMIEQSKIMPKKRAVHILRSFKDDSLPSVMFSALQPETYIHPHIHPSEKGKQVLIPIKGDMYAIIFGEQGDIIESILIGPDKIPYLEIPSRMFHTVVAIEPDTILCELYMNNHREHKEYKECAPWAPDEEDPAHKEYLEKLKTKISQDRFN